MLFASVSPKAGWSILRCSRGLVYNLHMHFAVHICALTFFNNKSDWLWKKSKIGTDVAKLHVNGVSNWKRLLFIHTKLVKLYILALMFAAIAVPAGWTACLICLSWLLSPAALLVLTLSDSPTLFPFPPFQNVIVSEPYQY